MAIAAYTRTNALARRQYSNKVHRGVQQKCFFIKNGMVSEDRGEMASPFTKDAGYPIIFQSQMGKGKGEHLTLPYAPQLSGDGVTANSTLIDSEEALDWGNVVVRLEQLRHATGSLGPLSTIANPLITKDHMTQLLTDWMVNKVEDGLIYSFYNGAARHEVSASLETAAAHPNTFYGVGREGFGDLIDTDEFNTGLLDHILNWTELKYINPITTPDGAQGFVVLAHPYQINSLMADPLYQASLQNARPRSKSNNPIWTNADHCWRGLAIYEYTRVMRPDSTPAGAVQGYTDMYGAVVLGANALALGQGGVGRRMIDRVPYEIVLGDQTDYKNRERYAIRSVWGTKLCTFTLESDSSTVNQSSAIFWTKATTQTAFA